MMPASDTGKGDRPRMLCARSGKKSSGGSQWIVDADLKDFFGSVQHDKLLALVARQVSDGRVLRLIGAMLKAGVLSKANASRPSRVPLKAGGFPLAQ